MIKPKTILTLLLELLQAHHLNPLLNMLSSETPSHIKAPMRASPLPMSEAGGAVPHVPYLPPLRIPVRQIGARTFDFSRQVAIMAVVNRTPDSFYDQGRTYAFDRAVDACFEAVALGAEQA